MRITAHHPRNSGRSNNGVRTHWRVLAVSLVVLMLAGCRLVAESSTTSDASMSDNALEIGASGDKAIPPLGPQPEAGPEPALLMLSELADLLPILGDSDLAPEGLFATVAAVQALAGRDITGSLSGADIAFLEATTGTNPLNETVRSVQLHLRSIGYSVQEADGIFGSETVAAWMAFTFDNIGLADSTLSEEALDLLDGAAKPPTCSESSNGEPDPFDAQQMASLAAQLQPPLTSTITAIPDITGDTSLDQQIVTLAIDRGYRLRSVPTRLITTGDGVDLEPRVAQDWSRLVDTASRNGNAVLLRRVIAAPTNNVRSSSTNSPLPSAPPINRARPTKRS